MFIRLVVLSIVIQKISALDKLSYLSSFFASTNTIAYQKLLNPLETLVPRKPAESLQEYSLRIEQEFKLDLRFIRLTTQYEAEIYGRQADPVKFDKNLFRNNAYNKKNGIQKILTKGSRFKNKIKFLENLLLECREPAD